VNSENSRFKIWIFTGGVILLAVSALWFVRPLYRHFKVKHGLAQAQVFLSHDDYRNAFLSARQVLLIDATNVPACRVMAGLADLSHSPAALDWRRKIVEIEPTVENKLFLASASLHYQNPPFPLAEQILGELPSSATNSVAFQTVAAEFDLRLKRFTGAQAHLEQSVRLDPTNKIFQLNLAVVQLNSTNPAVTGAARATLKQFQSDKDLGAAALRSLITDRLVQDDPAGALDYSRQLLAGTQSGLGDRLQQLGILRRLKSQDLTAQLNFVQMQSATNASAAAETATWMTANGFSAEAVQWLKHLPASFQTQPPVRLALVDGYQAQTNWLALRDFLAAGNWDEMDFLRLAFLSRALSQLGEPFVADNDWQAAVGEAGENFGALAALLNLAGRWELPREQEDLLWRIIRKFPGERWAARELERRYFIGGDTLKLNQLYAALFASFPKDVEIGNNLAATSLLLNTNLATAFKLAQDACAQRPDDPFCVSTYAYALHLQGRTRDGVEVLEKLKNESLEKPSTALYYGVLLSALGENEKAARFLALAETDGQLLPEEKQLLAVARKAQ
jgi:hypothetical protein